MLTTRIIGAGSFVPERVIDNERVAAAIPGWTAEKIARKTGIRERRFLWDFDDRTGRVIVPPDDGSTWPRTGTDMAEIAVRRALEMADVDPTELDGVFVVTSSPDELNFCHDAILLHHRLGCRSDAFAIVVDSGCGGALYVMDHARRMLDAGAYRAVAIVASTLASAFFDRDVYTSSLPIGGRLLDAMLTMYLFGDGAGAVILRGEPCSDLSDDSRLGILASASGTDSVELVVRRGGGAMRPAYPGRSTLAHHAFIVNGTLVAERFPEYMQRGIEEVTKPFPHLVPDIARYYLHQANKRLVEGFAHEAKLPAERLAMHMERYGNTSAAATLILLAEDLAGGVVSLGRGDVVLFAAIGAGVHWGAQLVRL
jgi:3-oxoacyl-[acyl-carrier-protein] synthase III